MVPRGGIEPPTQGFSTFCRMDRAKEVFLLLQDLVEENYLAIKFWHPFNGFDYSPLPKNIEEYQAYKINVIDFLTARNQRILISIR